MKKLLILALLLPLLAQGATITTIQGSDTLSASRSVINTNFSNLNNELAAAAQFAYLFPNNATTSSLTLGGLTLTGFSGGLGANGGTVYGAATTTFSTGLTYANGAVTCDVATGSVPGCLSAANWTTFNAKESALTFSYPLVRTANNIAPVATSTQYSNLSVGGLYIGADKTVRSAATTTFSGGLLYAAGNVTDVLTGGLGLTRTTNDFACDTATLSVFGCLAAADFTSFNGKISSSSLSGASVISYNSGTGVITTTGGTFGAGNYVFPTGVSATNATATTQLVAPIPRSFGISTTTMGSGTTTWKFPGEPFAKTYVALSCNSVGGGTFVGQFGDSTASTSRLSSTGLTSTFLTLSSNNVFTAGETVWFAFGSVSGAVSNPVCTVQ